MSSNYILGDTVKLVLQITENSIPLLGISNPKVEKIILPDGNDDPNFPRNMSVIDSEYGIHAFEYSPPYAGDYIVIFTFQLDGIKYSTIDQFVVSLGYSNVVPRAAAGNSRAPKAVAR